jgi:hypothetical protein
MISMTFISRVHSNHYNNPNKKKFLTIHMKKSNNLVQKGFKKENTKNGPDGMVWYGLKLEPKKFKKKTQDEKEEKKRNGESKTNPRRYAKREMRPCVCEQTIWQCTGRGHNGWMEHRD